MTAASVHRSRARSIGVGFRLSPEDRELLRERATSEGLTIQAYLEWKALDRPKAARLRSGRKPQNQEQLPMTG